MSAYLSSREKVAAPPNMVVYEVVRRVLLGTEVLQWVRPEYVAHQPMRWGLSEAVDLARVSSTQTDLGATY
jgi:hypothetical protein